MRFELSTKALHFYGSAEVLRKTTFLQDSDGLYYGRARFLRKKLATVSIEQLYLNFLTNDSRFTTEERLQNSKERCLILKITVILLQNDTR